MNLRSIFVAAAAFVLLTTSCDPMDYGYLYDVPEGEQTQKPQPGQQQEPEPEPQPDPVPEGVPVISIMVEGRQTIDSKEEYKNVSVIITENGQLVLEASGRVKGRGNATWGYEKKPYKIKFDEKQGVLGFAPNKDWVLLAEYCDKSLMRTAYMCELANAVGLPYPIHYRHVEVFMNNEYLGVYVLTDQVEKKKNRVAVSDDGFLLENDNYFWEEPLFFMTDYRQYWYTFKYPDPEDGEIAPGDESYNFITGFMNDFERALYGDNFKDPTTGYRKYIDVQSFAKWYLVMELTANLEPNMYYVLPSRDSKLQIAPVWDAEWSMGLAHRDDEYAGWAGLPTQPDRYMEIWSKWKYFGRLFEDEYFVDVVRQEWEALGPLIPEFKKRMKAVSDNIINAQARNFQRWQILGWHVSVGLINLGSWDKEVEYVHDFFADRINWLDEKL
jgi:hypothetical protein